MMYSVASLGPDEALGSMSAFLSDDMIEEIMYNGPNSSVKIFHSMHGMCDTNISISSKEAESIISTIMSMNGKTYDGSFSVLDASLPDGSRVNIALPPVSVDGPAITIRKFKKQDITPCDLLITGTMSFEVAAFLWCCIDGLGHRPANILVAGGTSSGKTTLLNTLSMFIDPRSRIITIEDTPELRIISDNLVRLETSSRPPVGMDMLLKNTLRMRPDRIIVGEVRGAECRTLFTAMNTGHDGCLGTIHSNTAKETLERVTNPPMDVPGVMVKALDLIVMMKNMPASDGRSRRVIYEISEVSGLEGKVPRLNTIYKYDNSKNELKRTGVPSQYRTKAAQGAGMTPRDFDTILQRRRELLEQMSRQHVDANSFRLMVGQNR